MTAKNLSEQVKEEYLKFMNDQTADYMLGDLIDKIRAIITAHEAADAERDRKLADALRDVLNGERNAMNYYDVVKVENVITALEATAKASGDSEDESK